MTYRPYFIGLLLALIILVPVYFNGGRNDLMGPVSLALITLLILVLNRNEQQNKTLSFASLILLVFLGWLIIDTTFFSRRLYASMVTALPILAGALIFLILQSRPLEKRAVKTFAYVLIGGAVAISLFGLFIYLAPEFSGLRLGATFYQHNAFAGFLVPILILSLYFLLSEPKLKFTFGLSSPVLATALFLTFSRGGFIAAGAGLLIFLFLLWRQSESKTFAKNITLTFFILISAGLLAYGIYSLKTANLASTGFGSSIAPTSPYAGERPAEGETGVASRIQYMKAALSLIKERPLTGSGLGSFGQEYLRIQTDPRFYSSDPHNLYLRMASELGLIGGLLFIIFIALAIVPRGLVLWRRQELDLFNGALLAGSVGLLVHYAVDLDFTFPAHVILFFIFLALLTKNNESKAKPAEANLKINTVLISASLILLLASSIVYFYDPLNPNQARQAAEAAGAEKDYARALDSIQTAIRIHPHDRDSHLLAGKILAEMGDVEKAETEFRQAIAYGPARDLEAYAQLTGLLHGLGRLGDAKKVAKAGLSYFPANIFESSLWVNPNKETIKFHRELLVKYLNL